MLAALTCVAGGVLGLTCSVVVLVPIFLVGTALTIVVSLANGYPIGDLLLAAVFPTICLQAGYMMGLTGRDTLSGFFVRAAPRTSKRA